MLNIQKLIFSILLLLFGSKTVRALPSQTPVIGIYTQTYDDLNSTYIAASYIKYLEMSGAQVVPIFSFDQSSSILSRLSKINGVLFTGGTMDFDINTKWMKNADLIFKFAIQQNKKGNIFPIYGICMGFQLLAYLTSNFNDQILSRVHGDQHIILPINIVEEGYLYQSLTKNQMNNLTKGKGVMFFNHNWAVTMDTFRADSYLKYFWKLTGTAITPSNQQFIASYQSKQYPIFGTQFHPQKSNFQWRVPADRSYQTIEISQFFSNKFVSLARKNKNIYDYAELEKELIYNYSPRIDTEFTQIYIFNETPEINKERF